MHADETFVAAEAAPILPKRLRARLPRLVRSEHDVVLSQRTPSGDLGGDTTLGSPSLDS